MSKLKVLVVSKDDADIGPMAAAFLGDFSLQISPASAGLNPAVQLHPLTQVVMRECLIDMQKKKPISLYTIEPNEFDVIVNLDSTVDDSDYNTLVIPLNAVQYTNTLEDFRMMRDWLKNQTFILFHDTLRKMMR